MNPEQIAHAGRILQKANFVVALTGAGMGKPSGIPDFRSEDGEWSRNSMELASLTNFRTNPQSFFNWLRPLMEHILAAKPNPAHSALAKLEKAGKLKAVITQNIDSLDREVGLQEVYEMHGSTRTATCVLCQTQVSAQLLIEPIRQGHLPKCPCGGILKPDITLFEESLPYLALIKAQQAMEKCDALLVAGSSLVVNPVASFPQLALRNGAPIIIVNFSETYLDRYAEVILREDVAKAIPAIVEAALV